jgi:hypothetical protein
MSAERGIRLGRSLALPSVTANPVPHAPVRYHQKWYLLWYF